LAVHIEGGTEAEGVRRNDAEKIFWSTRDKVRGEWTRLHNEEIHDVYISPDIRVIYSRKMRWAGHVEGMGDRRGAYTVLVERPEERRSLGRRKCRLEDNTKVELKEVRRGVVWIELA
jgi:hypothetical protein